MQKKQTTPAIDQATVPRHRLTYAKLAGDPNHPDELTRNRTRREWMRALVDAYNQAYREVGVPTFLTLPGARKEVSFGTWDGAEFMPAAPDPEEVPGVSRDGCGLEGWKNFKKLMAAAIALHERDIPPRAWAEWVISRRTKGKRLHVTAIFCASQVQDNATRHFFRKESGYGYGAGATGYAPTQTHLEQMYRLRERDRRSRGLDTLHVFPPWYSTLRQQEIERGAVDPMQFFPRTAVRP